MFPRTCDVRHVGIQFYTELGHVSKKMALFSFPLSFGFRLVICLCSHCFCLLVRVFPQHQIFQQERLHSSCQAFLISSCNLILFSGENMEHFCSFTNFSSLKLNIMTPKINRIYQVLMFLDCSGQVWQINSGK